MSREFGDVGIRCLSTIFSIKSICSSVIYCEALHNKCIVITKLICLHDFGHMHSTLMKFEIGSF